MKVANIVGAEHLNRYAKWPKLVEWLRSSTLTFLLYILVVFAKILYLTYLINQLVELLSNFSGRGRPLKFLSFSIAAVNLLGYLTN